MPRKKTKKKATVRNFSTKGKTMREIAAMKRDYAKNLIAENNKISNLDLKSKLLKKFKSSIDASSMAEIRKEMNVQTRLSNGNGNGNGHAITDEHLEILQGNTVSPMVKKRLDLLVASMRREGIDSIFISTDRPAVVRQTKELLVEV